MEESNIPPVSSPVTVCGDIHGQFWDLLERLGLAESHRYILRLYGNASNQLSDFQTISLTYFDSNHSLQQGDFVDRGYFSRRHFPTDGAQSEASFPHHIAPREPQSRQITKSTASTTSVNASTATPTSGSPAGQVFDYLNLAAIIDGRVLCVHGGLSPDVRTLDQIRIIARAQEVPHEVHSVI